MLILIIGAYVIGGNGYASFYEPKEFNVNITGQPENFYVGIQSWWGYYARKYRIYNLILVE